MVRGQSPLPHPPPRQALSGKQAELVWGPLTHLENSQGWNPGRTEPERPGQQGRGGRVWPPGLVTPSRLSASLSVSVGLMWVAQPGLGTHTALPNCVAGWQRSEVTSSCWDANTCCPICNSWHIPLIPTAPDPWGRPARGRAPQRCPDLCLPVLVGSSHMWLFTFKPIALK